MNTELITQIGQSTGSPEDLPQQLERHQQFVAQLYKASGGRPGRASWTLLDVSGLPMALLTEPKLDTEPQLVLRMKNLEGRDLRTAVLAWASMEGLWAPKCNFGGAELCGAMLCDSHLEGSSFRGADLRRADLSRALLRGASFEGADLRETDFENCDLTDCNFRGAKLQGARFPGAKGAPVAD